jgi:hypothetical protein
MAKKSSKPASKNSPAKKPRAAKRPDLTAASPRRLKPGKPKGLRRFKRVKHPVKLPSAWHLTKSSAALLWRHKKIFVGIALIYGLLNLILVQGLAGHTDVSSLKNSLNQTFSGHLGSLASSLSVFTVLVGSAGNGSSPTAGSYQFFLALFASLAVIWALRQLLAGHSIRIRDAYYLGMYPLIPFILVLMIIGLQLIPFVIGSSLYSFASNNGITVQAGDKTFWTLVFAGLSLWSIYMLTSSLFALYIVTLPNMTPLKALRSARQLVRRRRWTVMRKIICLPIILLIVAALIMVPIIIWLTPLAQWIFFLLTMFAVVVIHTYMYTLYRELLNE